MLRIIFFILLLPSLCICRDFEKDQRFLDDGQLTDRLQDVLREYIDKTVEERTQEIMSRMLENIDSKYKYQISNLQDKVMHLENQNDNTGNHFLRDQVQQVTDKNNMLRHRITRLEMDVKELMSRNRRLETRLHDSIDLKIISAAEKSYEIDNSSVNRTGHIANHRTSVTGKKNIYTWLNTRNQDIIKESTFRPENVYRRFAQDTKTTDIDLDTHFPKQVIQKERPENYNKQNVGRSSDVSKVAFTVQLTNRLSDAGTQKTLKFDKVVTNVGNGYNNSTGAFNCPVSGLYVFFHSLAVSVNEGNYFYTDLVKNGVAIGHNIAAGGGMSNDVGSGLTVVNLDMGDTVWVQTGVHPPGATVESWGTTFSGFLL